MPIRPIDMQVSIPKLSEVSRMSHLEQQKAGLHQNQNGVAAEKNTQKENRSVSSAHKDNKSDSEADARKKGRNTYVKNKKKGDISEGESRDDRPMSNHKIDIRI